MNIFRPLLVVFGLGAAAALGLAAPAAKKDCCAKDAACRANSAQSGCATADGCCRSDEKAGCKDGSACCAAHDGGAVAATAKDAGDCGCCASGDDAACGALVTAYLPIARALAADDLNQAQRAAAELARTAEANQQTAIYHSAIGVVHAADLASAREAFKHLSGVVTPLVAHNQNYVVMSCPMAKADWVQTDATVRNPYYGTAMLACGAPKAMARAE